MRGELNERWHLTRLTKHFILGEFFKNHSAGIPDARIIDDLYCLCVLVLERVREKYGPVEITSGYRDQVINQLVGGQDTSQHLTGKAVDFICQNVKMESVYNYIVDVIKWGGEVLLYKTKGHVHVGLCEFGVKSDHLILDQ